MPYRIFLFFVAMLGSYLLAVTLFLRLAAPEPVLGGARVARTTAVATATASSDLKASVTIPARRVSVAMKPLPDKPQKAPIKMDVHRSRWDRDVNAHPTRGAFLRRYRMLATAYAPINRGIEGGRWTKTERDGRSAHGVAVDPRIIPLGTKLWIPGYGHAIADDIGGAIKGHHVDVRMQDWPNVGRWGRRRVPVYVLEEPEEVASR